MHSPYRLRFIDQEQIYRVITHTLRSPITLMRGRAGLLRHLLTTHQAAFSQDFPDLYDACKTTNESLRIGGNVVNGILDTLSYGTNLDAILKDAAKGTTDLHPIWETLRNEIQWRSRARIGAAKQIGWNFAKPVGSALVVGQPNAIELVLRNLFENAFKYTFPGRTVQVDMRCVNGAWVLLVKNSGVPVNRDECAKVFQKGYRGCAVLKRAVKAEEGTGYGLYLVKRLVEAGGGEVRMETSVASRTEQSEGETTVIITFAPIGK